MKSRRRRKIRATAVDSFESNPAPYAGRNFALPIGHFQTYAEGATGCVNDTIAHRHYCAVSDANRGLGHHVDAGTHLDLPVETDRKPHVDIQRIDLGQLQDRVLDV